MPEPNCINSIHTNVQAHFHDIAIVVKFDDTPPVDSSDHRANTSEHGTDDEASDKITSRATSEGTCDADHISYENREDGNDAESLPQQGKPSPDSDAPEADYRREVAVERRPSISGVGGGGDSGDVDGDGDYLVKEKEEPGVWGPDGLLAIPNVKMVLFLAGAVQVI